VLCASVSNPVHTALPTSLCEHLETHIASGVLELPILPHVASQVLAMSTSDETNAGSLAALLHRDQVIAAHVLRVANCPSIGHVCLSSRCNRPLPPGARDLARDCHYGVDRVGYSTSRVMPQRCGRCGNMRSIPRHMPGAIARRCRRNGRRLLSRVAP
jgi:hypothetical protein